MTAIQARVQTAPTLRQWAVVGAIAAIAAVVAVLIVQAIAIALWPEVALFKPLDSYPRTVLFTIIPTFIATGLFAWLAMRQATPERTFLRIAAIVLLLSFLPDYLLPVANRTLLASSVAAFLHVIAAAVIVTILVTGYRRLSRR